MGDRKKAYQAGEEAPELGDADVDEPHVRGVIHEELRCAAQDVSRRTVAS
jgi:hypothetical protein